MSARVVGIATALHQLKAAARFPRIRSDLSVQDNVGRTVNVPVEQEESHLPKGDSGAVRSSNPPQAIRGTSSFPVLNLDSLRQLSPMSVSSSELTASTSSISTAPAGPIPPPKKWRPVLPPYRWQTRSPRCRIVYVRNTEIAERELMALPVGPLGFDMEWKPTFVRGQPPNPTSLLQLASADIVLLFQLSAMDAFPPKLREVLNNPAYAKIGVGIEKDCQKLYDDYAVSVRGCVELSFLARSVDNARWKGKFSTLIALAKLCEAYEQLSLPKGRVQRSNWESVLSDAQQNYAANDSHVAWSIYTKLMALGSAMPSPPRATYYTFNVVSGRRLQPNAAIAWIPHNPDYDPGPEFDWSRKAKEGVSQAAAPDPWRSEALLPPAGQGAPPMTARKRPRLPDSVSSGGISTAHQPAPSYEPRSPPVTSMLSAQTGSTERLSRTGIVERAVKLPQSKRRTRRRNRTGHSSEGPPVGGPVP